MAGSRYDRTDGRMTTGPNQQTTAPHVDADGGGSATGRRHVVVVTHQVPYPPDNGFSRRVFELVRRLATDHDITLVTYVNPALPDPVQQLEKHVNRVVAVPHVRKTGIARRMSQLAGLAARTPHHAQSLHSARLQRALDMVLATERVDVIQLESSQLGWLRLPADIPVVVDEHNVESQLLSRMASSETSLPLRGYYHFESWRYRRFEDRIWGRAAACLATSDVDRISISRRSPRLPVIVVPNAADVEGFLPSSHEVDPDTLLFVGLLEYRPNVDGVRFFIDQILPSIQRRRPSATLVVVGRGPDDLLDSLRRPGVHLTGWVPDVRPYLASAAVVVVPLRVGSGTRLKIVDAMSTAKPIVSTSIGAEGLQVEAGKHLLLADDPADFADAVVRLLTEEPLREGLGKQARQLAVDCYSWDRSAVALARTHARVLGGTGAPQGRQQRAAASPADQPDPPRTMGGHS